MPIVGNTSGTPRDLSLVPDLDLRDPASPLHVWVSKSLQRALSSGAYAVGDHLPTETELCRRYGVSLHTVRDALRQLANVGLVKSRVGVGTVVISNLAPTVFSYRSTSDSGLLNHPRATTYRRTESEGLINLDAGTARLLACEEGDEWFRLACTRRMDEGDVPLCWLEFYVLPEIAARVEWPKFERNLTVRDTIRRETGVQTARIEVKITAHTIQAPRAEQLEVSDGSSAMIMVRRMFDDQERNFASIISIHPEHRFTLELQFDTEQVENGGWSPAP